MTNTIVKGMVNVLCENYDKKNIKGNELKTAMNAVGVHYALFFHPDSGKHLPKLSVSELHRFSPKARGLYRRSGISPCPEDYLLAKSIAQNRTLVKKREV